MSFCGKIYNPLMIFACEGINKRQQCIKLFTVDRGKRIIETDQIVHPNGLKI